MAKRLNIIIFAVEISNTEFLLLSFSDIQQSKTEHGSEHEMKVAILYHRVVQEGILYLLIIMRYKIFKRSIIEVPEDHRVPRLLGDILTKMLHSDSPLAKGFRRFLASKEKSAGKGETV